MDEYSRGFGDRKNRRKREIYSWLDSRAGWLLHPLGVVTIIWVTVLLKSLFICILQKELNITLLLLSLIFCILLVSMMENVFLLLNAGWYCQ